MVTTIREVVDIVLNDFLVPPDSQPTRLKLVGAIVAGDTTLTYDDSLISPEELELLGAGAEIQIGTERILVGSVDETLNTLSNLSRGVNGTTAQAHGNGAIIEVAPLWPRNTVFRAVGDSIVALWPDLYGVVSPATPLTLSRTSYTEVPANVEDLIYLWVNSSGGNYVESLFAFLNPFPPSATGKAISTPVYYGSVAYPTYKVRFTRPETEDDTLADLALDEQWVRLIVIGTVAYLINIRDIDDLTEEHIDAQLKENQPNAAQSMRDRLLTYEQFLRAQAKRAQTYTYPTHQVRF